MLKEVLYGAGMAIDDIRVMDLDELIDKVLEYEKYNI